MAFSGILQEHTLPFFYCSCYILILSSCPRNSTKPSYILQPCFQVLLFSAWQRKETQQVLSAAFTCSQGTWYKSFLAGLTAPMILSDCCHTFCFSPEYFTLMLQFILSSCMLRTSSVAEPLSLCVSVEKTINLSTFLYYCYSTFLLLNRCNNRTDSVVTGLYKFD